MDSIFYFVENLSLFQGNVKMIHNCFNELLALASSFTRFFTTTTQDLIDLVANTSMSLCTNAGKAFLVVYSSLLNFEEFLIFIFVVDAN
jgi:hypothetical protein